jgi:tetratricopeptide (TPR) repeat protein
MTNPTDQEWIIKFDNFRMTDRQAEADRIAAEFEAKVLEENAGLIANMEALKTVYEGELNADNFASAKAKYSNTKAAFEKLSAEAQEVLKAKGYYQHISKAKKAIEDYEEVQQILKDNAKLIADLEALAAYKDASAFTADNYEAAKAAIEAARAAVDALTKTQKDALATYIAHLTAAEDALPAEPPKGPACTEHVDADKNGKCDNCDATVEVEGDNDNDNDSDDTTDGGCNSALTIGALATMILAGAWVTIAARKKED